MKNNRGSTVLATPLIWTITVFVFIFFIVFFVRVLEPFTVYQKISETALKYIFVMEEFGYLNADDKDSIREELQEKGLNINNINIYATDKVKNYGEVVELNIEYKYPFKRPTFNKTLIPVFSEENIDICISKKGVSKR